MSSAISISLHSPDLRDSPYLNQTCHWSKLAQHKLDWFLGLMLTGTVHFYDCNNCISLKLEFQMKKKQTKKPGISDGINEIAQCRAEPRVCGTENGILSCQDTKIPFTIMSKNFKCFRNCFYHLIVQKTERTIFFYISGCS